MSWHSQPGDCVKFLEEANSSTEETKKTIEKFMRAMVEQGSLDEFLLLFTRNIRTDDVHNVCIYLRSLGIFDQADQDRIFNDSVFSTPERKATELLTEIGKRGRHAYWYLAHALKTRHMAMFSFFHGGNFHCCVCKEIEAKEREEQLVFPEFEGEVTALAAAMLSRVKAFKGKFEEKCTTAKEAVKKRAEEKIKNKTLTKQVTTDEETAAESAAEAQDLMTHEENTNTADLECEVTALAAALSRMKAFKGKVEEKCTTAKEAVRRKRKRLSRPLTRKPRATIVTHSNDPQNCDPEGMTTVLADETDKMNQVKNERNLNEGNLVPKEQFCTVIRRKRAYKTAFATLSAVTLFTFYPLPAFDFLFLFIYCNLLILLITF